MADIHEVAAGLSRELLDANAANERLKAIVAKLPKCGRLDEHGKIVFDVPVVPTVDTVFERRYCNPGHTLVVMPVRVVNARHASQCHNTREAAEAAEKGKDDG